MTPEQKKKLDEIRDKLAKEYSSLNYHVDASLILDFKAGFDAAVSLLEPAIAFTIEEAEDECYVQCACQWNAELVLTKIFGNDNGTG